MRKFLLFPIVFLLATFHLNAVDCDECYKPTREGAIRKMQMGDYERAIEIFKLACLCPDFPEQNDIEAQVKECLQAIRKTQADSPNRGKGKNPVEKMLIPSDVKEAPGDNDAKSRYPRKTEKGELAALIKVYPTQKISETIVLIPEGGALVSPPSGITNRQADGSWWFWVTPSTSKLRFKVRGFEDTDPVSVFLEAGKVYTVKLLIVEVPKEETVGGWMRLSIQPPTSEVSYGPDINCRTGKKTITDGRFEVVLPYGDWYYRIESEGYETGVGLYEVSAESDWEVVELNEKVRYDYLTVESVPSGAEVRLDDQAIGTTPLNNVKIRKGNYRLQVSKDKFYPYSENITAPGEDTHLNRQITLKHLYGTVVCRCVDPVADLIVINKADGSTVATVKDGGSVQVKDAVSYSLESRRSGYTSKSASFSGSELAGTAQEVWVDAPVWIPAGKLNVSVEGPLSATVHVAGENGITYQWSTPVFQSLSPGSYSVWASADDYRDSKTEWVTVSDRQTTFKTFKLKKLPEFTRKQSLFASHFVNPTVGYNFATNDIVVGLRYSWCSTHMGLYLAGKYGIQSKGFGAMAGPVFRLTNDRSSGFDYQLYLGGGYLLNDWGGEAGMRFAWRSRGFSWWDFTLGVGATKNGVIPELGVGLGIPVSPIYGLVMLGIKSPQEYDYASNFLNLVGGYDVLKSSMVFGLQYAYCLSHLGVHVSASYGLSTGFAANIGPVFRLTEGWKSNCDFQLYGGIGYDYGLFGGEAGMRFAWKSSRGFSWWDFTLGVQATSKNVVPELGVGLLIPVSPIYGMVMLGINSPVESDFSSHFMNAIAGYNITTSDAMVGLQYAWCKTHLGIHVSAMYGVLRGGVAANIGPVFRLTDCWNSKCDYQLYGGIGYDYGGFGGEAGMRFAWRSSFDLSSWDFTLGVQAGPNGITPVIGLGWALALTVGGGIATGLGTYYLTRASAY